LNKQKTSDWWIPASIGVGVGVGVGALILSLLTSEERNARQRWEHKRSQVEKSIGEHRRYVDTCIYRSQSSYDYKFLVDLHFSSMRVADEAYRLLGDSRQSLYAINKMLKEAKEHRSRLQEKLELAKRQNDHQSIGNTIEELKQVNELRNSFFNDKDKVKSQKDGFYDEVKRLNNQTKDLKIRIKNQCGTKGSDWYNRLEARAAKQRTS